MGLFIARDEGIFPYRNGTPFISNGGIGHKYFAPQNFATPPRIASQYAPAFDSLTKAKQFAFYLSRSLRSLREMRESNPRLAFWRRSLYHLTNLPSKDKYNPFRAKSQPYYPCIYFCVRLSMVHLYLEF